MHELESKFYQSSQTSSRVYLGLARRCHYHRHSSVRSRAGHKGVFALLHLGRSLSQLPVPFVDCLGVPPLRPRGPRPRPLLSRDPVCSLPRPSLHAGCAPRPPFPRTGLRLRGCQALDQHLRGPLSPRLFRSRRASRGKNRSVLVCLLPCMNRLKRHLHVVPKLETSVSHNHGCRRGSSASLRSETGRCPTPQATPHIRPWVSA